MSITAYVKSCDKIIAGNDNKVYLAPLDDVDSITATGGEVSAITMNATALFIPVEADLDTVGFESSGTANRGFFSEQTLSMNFSNKSPELITLIEELRATAGCGIVAIRKNGNGDYFISGIAPVEEMGGNRPYLSIETNFNSGASIEDSEEGNMYTVSLSRMSGTEEYILDSTLAASIDSGTATFI